MLEVFVAVWLFFGYFEIALKNFGKRFHKGALVSHLLPSILQKKKMKFSGLKQVLSLCTSFHNNWLKTWLDIRNFMFLLNKELCRKFAAVLKVLPKMMTQIKYKNWHKFRSTFDFNLRFFLKVMLLESVSLNKTLS